MNPTRRSQAEELVLEDGSVSAKALPLDTKTSDQSYETATFGMG